MLESDFFELLHTFDPDRMLPGENHNGSGELLAWRARSRPPGSYINHLDLVVVRPGATIGHHRHAPDNEEFYIMVDGEAEMRIEDRRVMVRQGDVIRNPPGGAHGLRNTCDQDVKIVVIEVRTPTQT